MKPIDIFAALAVAACWGFNFVVIRVGIDSYPPLMLAALRYLVAALPIVFVARPAMSWPRLIAIGTFLFTMQFAFLFTGIGVGFSPGLASVVIQSQAIFTLLLSALYLHERLSLRQLAGACLGFAGLVCVGIAFVESSKSSAFAGFALILMGGLGWAIGNIIVRSGPRADMFATVAWTSLVPPLPLLALSFVFERPAALTALTHVNAIGFLAVLYLGFVATSFGYGIWGYLLNRYPASTVSQFAIAVPFFGLASSAIVFGERFGAWEYFGVFLVAAGLALSALPRQQAPRS